jgi:hypothetical protein
MNKMKKGHPAIKQDDLSKNQCFSAGSFGISAEIAYTITTSTTVKMVPILKSYVVPIMELTT